MNIKDWLVPDEFQSATHAGASLYSTANRTSHFWLKQFVGVALPFGLGVALYLVAIGGMLPPDAKVLLRGVITGVLTFVSVLAGFIVTLMLFTGRMEGAKVLTAQQAPVYVGKVTYLLFSQAVTLLFHIAGASCCIAWLLLDAVDSSAPALFWLLAISFGLLAVSIIRSLLLPLQIYELHQFELEAFVELKQLEAQAHVRSAPTVPTDLLSPKGNDGTNR